MPENTPGSRDNNPNPVTEQVPHSGVHGYERPVFDFDGNLEDALSQNNLHVERDEQGNMILVPNSLGEHRDPTKTTPTEAHSPLLSPEKPQKKSSLIKIGGAIGAVVLAGGAAFGIGAMNGGEEPQRERTGATPSTDTESEAPQANETPTTPEDTTAPEISDPENDKSVLSGIEGIPSDEVINYAATHPILIEGGKPSAGAARSAVITMGDYFNIYDKSGKLDQFELTPESAAIGEKILNNIYGPLGVRNPIGNFDFEALAAERESIAAGISLHGDNLVSLARTEPQGDAVKTWLDGNEVWQVPVRDVRTGNWGELAGPSERNNDYVCDYYLATYDTPEGAAWYLYNATCDRQNDTE